MVSQKEAMEKMGKHIKELEESQKAAEEKMDQKLAEHFTNCQTWLIDELRNEISEVESRLSESPKEEEKAEPEPPAEAKKKPKAIETTYV